MKVISSYFGNRHLRHVATDMKELARDGFTGVVHTFSENDLKYYADSFKDIVKVSHDAGLDVDLDPWGLGGVYGGEAFSAWISDNPNALQVSRNGKVRPCACLNNTSFRDFMRSWIDSAVNSGADGLFWDEPHLYMLRKSSSETDWTCACDLCRGLFRQKYGIDMPEMITDEIRNFRSDTVLDFLSEMLIYAKKSNARNTVCLMPLEFSGGNEIDWERLASLDGIDIISTDPYWFIAQREVADFVTSYSMKIKSLADKYKIEGQIWIQAFRVPSGREDELRVAIKKSVEQGIGNLAIWGFHACSDMSYLRCGDSIKTWQVAVDAFKSVNGFNE